MDIMKNWAILKAEISNTLIQSYRQRSQQRRVEQRITINASLFFSRRLLKQIKNKQKTIWSKKRSSAWWEDIVLKHFTDHDYLVNFRVDKITFNEICDLVYEDLAPKFTKLQSRAPISVEKKVAISLYKLASCAEYRIIGNNMGVCRFYLIKLKHT